MAPADGLEEPIAASIHLLCHEKTSRLLIAWVFGGVHYEWLTMGPWAELRIQLQRLGSVSDKSPNHQFPMPVTKLKQSCSDQRILIISSIGCGAPMAGNRERLKKLLIKMRELGLEIHFAGVALPASEKAATVPYVDQWVYDFSPYSSGSFFQRLIAKAKRTTRKLLAPLLPEATKYNLDLDQWFHPAWLKQARDLQRRWKYSRVMVMYVWNSAFLDAFPSSCLKLIDTHDIFTNRNARLRQIGLDDDNHWFSVSRNGERRGLMRADVILGIQKDESAYFQQLISGKRPIYTISHFTSIQEVPFEHNADLRFGLVASDAPLNAISCQWFLKHVWPIVLGRCPSAIFVVAGKISHALEPAPGMEVLGMVEDLQLFYQSILFVINPSQEGTGLKIKTVEALAHGRCVISTPSGAEGLDEYPGEHLRIATSADGFANLMLQALIDPERTRGAGREGCTLLRTMNENSTQALIAALQAAPAPSLPHIPVMQYPAST
jgi:glycosyltransferase involved in cell wall biosynthesis